ncbi:hypothetical protein SDC9_182552 [bioreactor metagenome]|uniref:Uncharacterized protein n=1 Tax=bioreactor metagenome TaxID=1076179 RepID=A0A645H7V2_9ZZZZ
MFDNNNQPLTEIIFSDIQRIKAQYSERKNLFITTNSKLNIDFGVYLPQFSQISASMVGVLSTVMYSRHEFADSNELVPLYVQDFVPINHTK